VATRRAASLGGERLLRRLRSGDEAGGEPWRRALAASLGGEPWRSGLGGEARAAASLDGEALTGTCHMDCVVTTSWVSQKAWDSMHSSYVRRTASALAARVGG
jgi:hypothetical protein